MVVSAQTAGASARAVSFAPDRVVGEVMLRACGEGVDRAILPRRTGRESAPPAPPKIADGRKCGRTGDRYVPSSADLTTPVVNRPTTRMRTPNAAVMGPGESELLFIGFALRLTHSDWFPDPRDAS